MFSEVGADIIWVLHMTFVAAMIVVPFTKNQELLNAYKLLVPFLFFQWSMRNSKCFMSVVEARLRGKEPNETFIGKLIHPVYDLSDKGRDVIIRMTTLFLYLYVLFKTGCVKIDLKKIPL